ncbi:MAG: hypothetical protein ACYTE0_08875, partial [Planctomycetota bacterium]|jgi:hypothetical protein
LSAASKNACVAVLVFFTGSGVGFLASCSVDTVWTGVGGAGSGLEVAGSFFDPQPHNSRAVLAMMQKG